MGGLHALYDRNAGAKGDIDSQLNKTVGKPKGWVYVALVRVSDNYDFVFPVVCHCAGKWW
ncbi:hypothetical protein HanXRQr2_Chr14g0635371 [Helianthus annuus]|uniref:Uncharacterized protein n=1 Tax=Helianthus annuus TaxID=4232 RepID=A0A9K3E865_HELAN|nr:hypothetical protein HanXRQr2_Chr14g0635371 [Helianthus annuus]KAJ0839650.1 hypothetical protein HanPSC8_Chr14g0609361 [Helianthus annuus]